MNDSTASIAALAGLVADLVREKDETRRLLAAFSKGEMTSEQIVTELASRYHLEVGGAVQALAEYDKDAAQKLGERLRLRLDSALADIAGRGTTSKSRPADSGPAASRLSYLKDREDDVLLREYVLVSALCGRNADVRSADLIKAAKEREPDVTAEAVTAHLLRLVNGEIVGKERKGRYFGNLHTSSHRDALAGEIEARGLRLP